MNVVRGVRCVVTVAVGPLVVLQMVGFAAGLSMAWAPVVCEAKEKTLLGGEEAWRPAGGDGVCISV